jgi:beta-1,4-mannosyl-glycoprotein beta-1,4-N-acetylglucosaminyltransferase
MKIIDSFIFYNELDLLFYRLSILDQYVDYFILVESTHTFTGIEKPLFYNENKERFHSFNDKIIHIVVDDFPYKLPNINLKLNNQWINEYHQRNCIKRGMDKIVHLLNDDDIIITSDVDEIPNPNILSGAINKTLAYNFETLNRLELDMYYYNLNYRVGEGNSWHGVKLITVYACKKLKLTFQQMRTLEWNHFVPIIKNGGWHLTYFGDIDYIINKINSFSHHEYNNEKYIDRKTLEMKIKNGINFLNMDDNAKLVFIPINENKNLPYKYDTYLSKYYIE